MKGIKSLILKHDGAKYLFTGMCSALRGFLNLHQGGMLVTEYQERWKSGKDLVEEFRYKVGERDHATDRECEADGISSSGPDYAMKRSGLKAVA